MECSMIELLQAYSNECSHLISQFDEKEAFKLISEIIEIFQNDITNIDLNLNYTKKPKNNLTHEDYNWDLRVLRGKLRNKIAEERRNVPKRKRIEDNETHTVNIWNTQNQTVHNTFDIKVKLDKVREKVEADEVLDDDVKEEINSRLNKIEEVMNGASTNNEKWKKLKDTFIWISGKSYKVGEWIIPLITKALFPEQ